jgi:hypothetical protein
MVSTVDLLVVLNTELNAALLELRWVRQQQEQNRIEIELLSRGNCIIFPFFSFPSEIGPWALGQIVGCVLCGEKNIAEVGGN